MTLTNMTLVDLEDQLHEAASSTTALHDFGSSSYRDGLRVLLNAFDTEMELTPSGRQYLYDWMLELLVGRLYVNKGWEEHPNTLKHPISPPIVIIGIARSGTTAMQRLLSLDTQFQGIELWLLRTPMIRPPRETWPQFLEYRATVEIVERYRHHHWTSEVRKAHDTSADDAEESTSILMQTFCSRFWETFGLPSYATWIRTQSLTKPYSYFADVLRLIGARSPDNRWLLKSPVHTREINALLSVFPGAHVIQMHRDPIRTIPSACSLNFMEFGYLGGDFARHEFYGPRVLEAARAGLECAKAATERSPTQFFHVDHPRFLLDPLGIIRDIYAHFGLVLSPNIESKMREWIAARPLSRHGEHIYPLDAWGVTPRQLREAFADYRVQHGFAD